MDKEYIDKFKNKAKVFGICGDLINICPFKSNDVLCASPLSLSDEEISKSTHVCTQSLYTFSKRVLRKFKL